MSQDNQNSQSSSSPSRDENQSCPRQYQKVQPFWKAKTIQILKGAIALLETTVEKLETESSTTAEKTPSFLQPLLSGWGGLLTKIRSVLPGNWNAKLSDTGLTVLVVAIAVILVWTISNILTAKPAPVATVSPTSPDITTSATPQGAPSPAITTLPESPPSGEETTPPTPQPKPQVTFTPTPTPTLELTPEQSLIAAIENQVAQVSDRLAPGLIKSIQANFLTSTLTIKISDDWYTLEESQQNNLGAQILQHSQELGFTHLEIIDSQNKLVARNPVIGNEMVIFRRR